MNLLLLPASKNCLIIKMANCNSRLKILDYAKTNYPFIILAPLVPSNSGQLPFVIWIILYLLTIKDIYWILTEIGLTINVCKFLIFVEELKNFHFYSRN